MREVILTGYGRKEAIKAKGKVSPRCYICKRKHGDKWVGAIAQKNGYTYRSTKMGFEWIEIIKGNGSNNVKEPETKFRFFICHECALLLEAISERNEIRSIDAI